MFKYLTDTEIFKKIIKQSIPYKDAFEKCYPENDCCDLRKSHIPIDPFELKYYPYKDIERLFKINSNDNLKYKVFKNDSMLSYIVCNNPLKCNQNIECKFDGHVNAQSAPYCIEISLLPKIPMTSELLEHELKEFRKDLETYIEI